LLKSGGRFIATFPCSDRIARRLRNVLPVESGENGGDEILDENQISTDGDMSSFSFGNKLYRITFSADEIVKLIPETADAIGHKSVEEFEQILDSIDFDDVVSRVSSSWGEQYKFWLTETIADQEEYIVPTAGLEKVLTEAGLTVEMSGNFAEIIEHYKANDSPTVKEFFRYNKNISLSDDEDEVFRFYRAVVVKKP
jgi:hypothetical protein